MSVCVSDLKDSRFLDLILTNLTWFRCLCLFSQKAFCVDVEAWVKNAWWAYSACGCVCVCVYACMRV